jgi:hypothetical protein
MCRSSMLSFSLSFSNQMYEFLFPLSFLRIIIIIIIIMNSSSSSGHSGSVSRDSAVGIAIAYGLDDRGVGVRVPVGSRIFSSPRLPYGLWGQSNFLSSGYRGFFPQG